MKTQGDSAGLESPGRTVGCGTKVGTGAWQTRVEPVGARTMVEPDKMKKPVEPKQRRVKA